MLQANKNVIHTYHWACQFKKKKKKKLNPAILHRSNQCSTTDVTKAVVCAIMYVMMVHIKNALVHKVTTVVC